MPGQVRIACGCAAIARGLCLLAVLLQLGWPAAMMLHRLGVHTDAADHPISIRTARVGELVDRPAVSSGSPHAHDESQCPTCQLLCTVRAGSLPAIAAAAVVPPVSIPRIDPTRRLVYIAPTPSGRNPRAPPAP
ncbi:DUF2946 family protein [Fontivita pretiosa]|uniref:DUF2946 family protein n=1 Tax=Fontivita pretiosa TaxID=2989684 RepID=UPI003D177FA0